MTDNTLGPLPDTDWTGATLAYSAEQMREYGAHERAAERERLRVLVEAVRDANAAASGRGDSFHLCTEAQRMAWVRLMDVVA
jgi:hypothetical protein